MMGAGPELVSEILKDLKILFFDIGHVFVSDDPSGVHCYKALHDALIAAGKPESAADFFARRSAAFLKDGAGLWGFAQSHTELLPNGDFKAFQKRVRAELYSRWPHFSPAVPGMAEVARELAKHYRLGIIANQPKEVVPLLEERGLLDLFEVHGVSDVLGMEKPDPRFFRWALEQAKVEPHEAMMIGDRLDNDVSPAKALGMKTVWLRLGHEARGWEPQTEFEKLYLASMREGCFSEREPRGPEEEPDFVANSPEELLEILTASREEAKAK